MDMLVDILIDLMEFHGGYGVGQRNLEGRMLLVLFGEAIMCVKYMV